ncbi:MAG: hypothetical protein JO142_05670 [Burkholderiales bacterium]|nr:hypothetical protein [Burkholderiales bacterium]
MNTLTLHNGTDCLTKFVVHKNQQYIPRLPIVQPGAILTVPTGNRFEIVATTVIDGRTYTSGPINTTEAAIFVAEVLNIWPHNEYMLNIKQIPRRDLRQLQFRTTCLRTVTFTIKKNGQLLGSVAVSDPVETINVDVTDTYHVYAIINGITTKIHSLTNPNTVVSAVRCSADEGYFALALSQAGQSVQREEAV